MKKKNKFIVLGVILITLFVVFIIGPHFIKWLFFSQYNENGVSHYLVITVDNSQSKEYIGELDGHKIYVEKLNLKETNFRNVNAENVSIKKAIDKKLVSIAEWKKYAWKVIKKDNIEIYKYENYEIACTIEEYTIRPLSK